MSEIAIRILMSVGMQVAKMIYKRWKNMTPEQKAAHRKAHEVLLQEKESDR